jgi:methyl acetate hydrolase
MPGPSLLPSDPDDQHQRGERMVVQNSVDALLERAVATGAVPGVVALAADARDVIYVGAFGRRDLDGPQAMTPNTVLRIASLTKLVTCVAALQLVERGALSLDAPLGPLLPALASPQVLDGFDADGQPQLRPARRPITLRHLLTHTAGFGYHIWNAALNRYRQGGGGAELTGKLATLGAPLVFDPGARWEYGINIDWVGEAVEQASGRSLEDYLQARIFQPLGMQDTGFLLTPEREARVARLHRRHPDGSLTPIPPEPWRPPVFFAGGGGLYSTAPDYLRFLQALLSGGTHDGVQILQPESVRQLVTNQIGDLAVPPFRTAVPALSNDGDFFPGMVKRWSLGGMLTTDAAPTGRSAGSLSWCGLFNCYYWLDPTRRLTGVLGTQITPFFDPPVFALAEQFEQAISAGHGT